MKELLTLSLLVEPDRQRLARFAIEAVGSLGGNVFAATATLHSLLALLRREEVRLGRSLEVRLGLEERRLGLSWNDETTLLAELSAIPEPADVDRLAEQLRLASETADPELLKRRNQKISEELEEFMRVAADQMAEMEETLERKKNELAESIRLAETDALTGLLNRGAYDDRLRNALLRAQRQQEPLCLLLLDLDKFKEINDTHGHQYGDRYLCKMADAMREAVREHVDIPCRMGGDEFAIIAFTELRGAERIAREVLKGMDNRVSIGVAQARSDDDVERLVARTDGVLYEAKRRGRGRFVSAKEALREVANG